MYEEELLKLFETVNIGLGKLKPRVIKAWFDTDCENILKWICTSVTEECYVPPLQDSEFAQSNILTQDELNEEVKAFESQYPGIFEVDLNLFDIEVAKDSIETLEEELRYCNHQINVNRQLYQNLSNEKLKVSDKEIKFQLEEEYAFNNCLKLSEVLDKISNQTYDQILKYSFYLNSYEFTEFQEFANNVKIVDFEEKFSDAANNLSSIIKIESDLFETSAVKHVTDTLAELEDRIFHSRISHLALQMEVEALNCILHFLEKSDLTSMISFVEHDALALSIGATKEQQSWMLKVIEETSAKLAQHYINQPALKYLQSENDFLQLKLKYLNKVQENLMKLLLHLVNMHNLYLQEKLDIDTSSQFFRNINQYVKNEIKDSTFRKKAMLRLVPQYEEFCLLPLEHRLKLMGGFGRIVLQNDDLSIKEIQNRTISLRNKTKKLKQDYCNSIAEDVRAIDDLRGNVNRLNKFFICGPTSRTIIVPFALQTALRKADKTMSRQNSSIKLLIQTAQKPKEHFAKDKWLSYGNLLWFYFMTDPAKLISFVGQLKKGEQQLDNRNIKTFS